MGSSPSKTKNENQHDGEPREVRATTPLNPPPVSIESFQVFVSNLEHLPFTLSEEQFETVIYHLVEKTFSPGDVILQSGEPAVGLFVIISGMCNVLASDGVTVLRHLKKTDFFGEISSVYSSLCSCSIVCGDEGECQVILLPEKKIQFLVQNGGGITLPIKQLFVQQKYIDTNSMFTDMDIYEIIIKRSMLQTPVFHEWSESAISLLYNSVLPTPIELYEPSRIIFFPDDQTASGYLLISGEVEVFNESTSFVMEAKEESYWFGDEQLFSDNAKVLTARAKSPCEIVVFPSESFSLITGEIPEETSKFPEETRKLTTLDTYWQKHLKMRDPHLYEKHHKLMNVMSLSNTLRQSDIFKHCSTSFVYYIGLTTILRLVHKDDIIMSHDVENENELLVTVILFGGGVVLRADVGYDENLYPGDVFYFDETYKDKCSIKALEDTLVGFISKSSIDDVKVLYPEGLVNIDWYKVK